MALGCLPSYTFLHMYTDVLKILLIDDKIIVYIFELIGYKTILYFILRRVIVWV